MKKNVSTLILLMAATAWPMMGHADGLVPENCTLGQRPEYAPIKSVLFTFDRTIGAVESASATIYLDDEALATGRLTVDNFVEGERVEGYATITFDEPVVLPKGADYRLVVPQGTIFGKDDTTLGNDEIAVEFCVPATLGEATPTIAQGASVDSDSWMGFYFGTEVKLLNDGEVTLLREGVAVRTYPCEASWDWELGFAGVHFGRVMKFEDGVKYTLLLPGDCVSALYRQDITNEEAAVDFYGACTDEVTPLAFVDYSISRQEEGGAVECVTCRYDKPVMLTGNPKVRIYDRTAGLDEAEVAPTLEEREDGWVLTADLGQLQLSQAHEYACIIPEATVVTRDGDIIVNSRQEIDIDGTSGITAPASDGQQLSISGRTITVNGIEAGATVSLHGLDGRKVMQATAYGNGMCMSVPSPGVYVLTINNRSVTVNVK